MRLSKIKLAGFKSFVDPTTFLMPGQRLGIVGPNGCGKSNIIDAVRWVMGESSVRQLRGESMEDVIFNGSSNRKPVGQASIELVFDNSAGKLEGAWGRYSEISVKRIISRGGQSVYQINNTRCRRRDITEIFLGTGLGPRSYAIIEQGTISRIIESKPEELRVFLEEAAGISKYKERRRETETHIRHTRENLDRLNDVRSELDKQLQHLQRQARNAEKYKQYRAEERQLKSQLLALRWRSLNTDIHTQEGIIRDHETALASFSAEFTSLETQLVEGREKQSELSEILNRKQEEHYQVGSELARLEQTLEHQRQLRQRQNDDIDRTEQGLQQTQAQLDNDQARLQVLTDTIEEYQQTLAESQAIETEYSEQLAAAEQAMRTWQQQWQTFNQRNAERQRVADVETTRIDQLQRQQQQNQQRDERLRAEQAGLADDDLIEQIGTQRLQEQESLAGLEIAQTQLEESETRIVNLRDRQIELNRSINELQQESVAGQGRLSSLKTLQEAALSDREAVLQDWLQTTELQQAPRLVEQLEVEPGWEQAVEVVLAPYLEARCVTDIERPAAAIERLQQGQLTLLNTAAASDETLATSSTEMLSNKIQQHGALAAFLAGVYISEDLEEALRRHRQLKNGESLVTRSGVWLGKNWLRVIRHGDASDTGVLLRERQIRELENHLQQSAAKLSEQRQIAEQITRELDELEQSRKHQQSTINQHHRDHAQLESQVATLENRLQQIQQRREAISAELEDLQQQVETQQQELLEAQQRLQDSLSTSEQLTQERELLLAQQDDLSDRLEQCRNRHEDIRQATQEKIVASESLKSEYNALQKTQQRLHAQQQELQTRYQQLQNTQPLDDEAQLKEQLAALLQRRLQTEQAVSESRQAVDAENIRLQQLERQRSQCQNKLQSQRETLEKLRLNCNEASVRRQTLVDQLNELDVELTTVVAELPDEAEETEWQTRLEALANRIQRLGAINLAAIEEFEQLSERKTYLDAQNDDLMEALTTLETAMARIDRETRSRFQDMYDKVNEGLQNLFPRLFGGGQAYLDLTGDDALEAGVTIMARPPGKRNGTIHLLSGGEKALTAVAFIFAIFQLNPAPFCMLDEVDAPLDDANVSRFGMLLKEMSDQVQFIVVTHNKVTMEVVDQLIGVTMHEPGVSRLVSVDVDEAVQLAAV